MRGFAGGWQNMHAFSSRDLPPLRECFSLVSVRPAEMDRLWALGFRHFGTTFFRYNRICCEGRPAGVIPLRIHIPFFRLSRSQKRIQRRNRDMTVVFREAALDAEKEAIFQRHKARFREHAPAGLSDVLSPDPARIPCPARECCLYLEDRLVGVGFLDVGQEATSAVYTAFLPGFDRRSLGIYTLLAEIAHSRAAGKRYLYHGYAYDAPSFYDYKKRFHGLEGYDWRGRWIPLERAGGPGDAP